MSASDYFVKIGDLILPENTTVLVELKENNFKKVSRNIKIKTSFYENNFTSLDALLKSVLALEKIEAPIRINSAITRSYSIFYVFKFSVHIKNIKNFNFARSIEILASEFISETSSNLEYSKSNSISTASKNNFFNSLSFLNEEEQNLYLLSKKIYGHFSYFSLILSRNPFIKNFKILKNQLLSIPVPALEYQRFILTENEKCISFYKLSEIYYGSPFFAFKIRKAASFPLTSFVLIPPLLSLDSPVYKL